MRCRRGVPHFVLLHPHPRGKMPRPVPSASQLFPGDLLLREVACGIRGPGVAGHGEGADAETPPHIFRKRQREHFPFKSGRRFFRPAIRGSGGIHPDLAKRALAHVAEGVLLPELVRVYVALRVDIAETDARRVGAAAVPFEEAARLLRALGVRLAQAEIEVRAIHVVIHGENIDAEAAAMEVERVFQDDIHRPAGLRMAEVVTGHIATTSGIDEMVEAGALDSFLLNEAEDGVDPGSCAG